MQEDEKKDFLLTYYIKPLRNEKFKKISEKLEFLLQTTDNIKAFDTIDKSKTSEAPNQYLFQVHNVGQAQATSLAISGKTPFLYFDYGLPYGVNSHTTPPTVNIPIEIDTSIVLSHIDKDHWFGISNNINAFKCSWYIPNQKRGMQFNCAIAQIIANGGSVKTINSDIWFSNGYLTCGGMSKSSPSRVAGHKHETGLSLRLSAYDMSSRKFNILIAGDQRYDYISNSQLHCLDVLVASHHGGTYCWSEKCKCVPTAHMGKAQTIIYSYGARNTYNHPSRVIDYCSVGWVNSHHTTKGDYKILILL